MEGADGTVAGDDDGKSGVREERVVLSPYIMTSSEHAVRDEGGDEHEGTIDALEAYGYQLDQLEFDEDPLGGSWAANRRPMMETHFPSLDEVNGGVPTPFADKALDHSSSAPSKLQGAAQRLELMPPAVREVDDQPRAPDRLELHLQFGRLDSESSGAGDPVKLKRMESEV